MLDYTQVGSQSEAIRAIVLESEVTAANDAEDNPYLRYNVSALRPRSERDDPQ